MHSLTDFLSTVNEAAIHVNNHLIGDPAIEGAITTVALKARLSDDTLTAVVEESGLALEMCNVIESTDQIKNALEANLPDLDPVNTFGVLTLGKINAHPAYENYMRHIKLANAYLNDMTAAYGETAAIECAQILGQARERAAYVRDDALGTDIIGALT